MSNSTSVTPNERPSVHSKPPILATLPDYPISTRGCSSRIQQRLDLLMLALESLELAGTERLLATAKLLKLQAMIDNRVVLWRLRCTNPWRRSYMRRSLQVDEAKALTLVLVYRARQLTVPIRQLLMVQQQLYDKGVPLEQNFSLHRYLERFHAHFKSRMNPRRVKVANYLAAREQLNALALSLLNQLLFCTGTAGEQRLWSSLFDGEIR